MEINKLILLVNLDIDKSGELRQVVLNNEEHQLLKQLLIKGAICNEIKLLDKPVESIIIENKD